MTNAETLYALLAEVSAQGISRADVHRAETMLDYREYELAFDMVLHQLHEHHIQLKNEQVALIELVASRLHVPETEFLFVKSLVQ